MEEAKLQYIDELFKKNGISLQKRQVCQFYDYYRLLVEWNEKMNLTAITDFEDVCIKHFLDSACMVKMFGSYDKLVDSFQGQTLVDVGTGAGFPGIVLKILVPGCKITLIDSLDKRIRFLNEVIAALDLSDICAVHGRVEDCAKNSMYREQFDFSTARAVAQLPVLSEYCIPFVKVGGKFVAYKSEKTALEISSSHNAFGQLGGKLSDMISFNLGETELERTLVVIDKVRSTPLSFPRKAGVPSKKPL